MFTDVRRSILCPRESRTVIPRPDPALWRVRCPDARVEVRSRRENRALDSGLKTVLASARSSARLCPRRGKLRTERDAGLAIPSGVDRIETEKQWGQRGRPDSAERRGETLGECNEKPTKLPTSYTVSACPSIII